MVGPPEIVVEFPEILTVGLNIGSSETIEMVTTSPTFAQELLELLDEIDIVVRVEVFCHK